MGAGDQGDQTGWVPGGPGPRPILLAGSLEAVGA